MMMIMPSVSAFVWALVCLAGLGEAIKFLVEPSFEYYGGRGQCLKYRISGGSLCNGYFRIAPQPDVKCNVVVRPSVCMFDINTCVRLWMGMAIRCLASRTCRATPAFPSARGIFPPSTTFAPA